MMFKVNIDTSDKQLGAFIIQNNKPIAFYHIINKVTTLIHYEIEVTYLHILMPGVVLRDNVYI